MTGEGDDLLAAGDLPEVVRKIRTRTPARILNGRVGAAYRTATQIELREAHAAARDAVKAEFGLEEIFATEFIDRWKLFEVHTKASTKGEYLLRPDLGRQFDEASCELIRTRCERSADLQIAIGDGLSVTAVKAQVPRLLPLICEKAQERGWKVGHTFAVRYCRVGAMNEIGELLEPKVVVLLIGERPGLATVESLSAYMGYRPRAGHTDANRNLISNIHARGLSPDAAAERILNFAGLMMRAQISGSTLREELPTLGDSQ